MFIPTRAPQPEIIIDRGVECNGEYKFSVKGKTSKLHVVKEESNELAYKVSILYRGIKKDRPVWTIHINDKLPKLGKQGLCYDGSNSLVFNPAGAGLIEVQETYENNTESLWVDLSEKTYTISRTLPVVNEKIQSLIEKGKFFKPEDDKEVKKIFWSEDSGVFLYARNKSWDTDIYHAIEGEEFAKCESRIKLKCKCAAGDSKWDVILPGKTWPGVLEFPQGNVGSGVGHGSELLWEGAKLKSITL